MKVAILCCSTRSANGLQEDLSTPVLRGLAEKEGWEVVETALLPDDEERICRWLVHACDETEADLVLTTGGTGVNPRDVTPEATRSVVQRSVPGIPEAMRLLTLRFTRYAMLSRGVAGVRGSSLVVNLPGSPKAVQECFDAVKQSLAHAVDAIHGRESHRRTEQAAPPPAKGTSHPASTSDASEQGEFQRPPGPPLEESHGGCEVSTQPGQH